MPLRPLATNRFLLRVSSDLGGVSLFRIHCHGLDSTAAVDPVSGAFSAPCRADGLRRHRLRFACGRVVRAFGLFGSVANELHFCHCAGCRTFFAHLCAHLLRSAVLYLSVFKHRVDRLQTYFFLPCLSSDCAGVWPFRIRCQRASFLSLRKSGCPTIFAHLCAHQAAAVVRLCLRAGPLVFSSRGSKGGTSAPGE